MGDVHGRTPGTDGLARRIAVAVTVDLFGNDQGAVALVPLIERELGGSPASVPPERTPEAPERIWLGPEEHDGELVWHDKPWSDDPSDATEYVRADLVRAATTGSPEGTADAVAAEREACARLVQAMADEQAALPMDAGSMRGARVLHHAAAAIRRRRTNQACLRSSSPAPDGASEAVARQMAQHRAREAFTSVEVPADAPATGVVDAIATAAVNGYLEVLRSSDPTPATESSEAQLNAVARAVSVSTGCQNCSRLGAADCPYCIGHARAAIAALRSSAPTPATESSEARDRLARWLHETFGGNAKWENLSELGRVHAYRWADQAIAALGSRPAAPEPPSESDGLIAELSHLAAQPETHPLVASALSRAAERLAVLSEDAVPEWRVNDFLIAGMNGFAFELLCEAYNRVVLPTKPVRLVFRPHTRHGPAVEVTLIFRRAAVPPPVPTPPKGETA